MKKFMKVFHRDQKGFTLMELLVVVCVIAFIRVLIHLPGLPWQKN